MKFQTGDRVVYVSGNYSTGRNNPLLGTSYECQGTIDYLDDNYIQVQWDNGNHNSYNDHDLQLVSGSSNNPNMAFKLKKRRGL